MINLLLVLGLIASLVWAEKCRRRYLEALHVAYELDRDLLKLKRQLLHLDAVVRSDRETIKHLEVCLHLESLIQDK